MIIETRQEKAIRLCSQGRVEVWADNPQHAAGIVEGDHSRYLVSIYNKDDYTCQCDWGRMRHSSGIPCSHVLALGRATQRYVTDEKENHE